MKTDKLLMIAEVYRKAEIKSYDRIDERTRKSVTYYSYPVLLDDGVNVVTVNVPETLYNILEPRNKYVFVCSINTDSQFASSRFAITGIFEGTAPIDGREEFAVVPQSVLRSGSNSSKNATKEA